MPLTAIMPVHNEATVLAQVLDSVVGQTLPPDEFIIVLDDCTDGSESIALQFSAKTLRVNLRNTSGAILAAVADASNDLLVLFDGNTIVPSNFVKRLLEEHERSQADVIEWHGGMMLLSKSTLRRFGPFSTIHLWTLEYFLRVESRGGKVVRLNGPHYRTRPSPLRRNLHYGFDYAHLWTRYPIAPFFKVGTKSGFVPDFVALCGTSLGHLMNHHILEALRDTARIMRQG